MEITGFILLKRVNLYRYWQKILHRLGVALGSSSCEAIVEGFYILINVHKKSGGQSKDMLVQRTLVDWTLPYSISCSKTMKLIARIYTDGDPKTDLIKHKLSKFFDKREPACKKYERSKAADKLKNEPARFCFIVKAEL